MGGIMAEVTGEKGVFHCDVRASVEENGCKRQKSSEGDRLPDREVSRMVVRNKGCVRTERGGLPGGL